MWFVCFRVKKKKHIIYVTKTFLTECDAIIINKLGRVLTNLRCTYEMTHLDSNRTSYTQLPEIINFNSGNTGICTALYLVLHGEVFQFTDTLRQRNLAG